MHTSSLGNPIFGDEKYGGGINKSKGFIPEVSKKLNASMNQLGRHALHARKIVFNHPINKKSIAISAKIPNEINELSGNKENLIKAERPISRPGVFTENGRWVDGWVTRRRRDNEHDFAIIKLGHAGVVKEILVSKGDSVGAGDVLAVIE